METAERLTSNNGGVSRQTLPKAIKLADGAHRWSERPGAQIYPSASGVLFHVWRIDSRISNRGKDVSGNWRPMQKANQVPFLIEISTSMFRDGPELTSSDRFTSPVEITSLCQAASFHKDEVSECSVQPPPRVGPPQSRSGPISDIIEKPLQRYEPVVQPKLNAATNASLVRAAQQPSVRPIECMSPKRSFASIQCNVGNPGGQFRTFVKFDCMDRRKRRTQLPSVDPLFWPSTLESRLRFRYAILHSLDGVASRERAPRAGPVGFQDDIRVNEYGAMVSYHFTDQPGSRHRVRRTSPPNLRWSTQAGWRCGGSRHGPCRLQG